MFAFCAFGFDWRTMPLLPVSLAATCAAATDLDERIDRLARWHFVASVWLAEVVWLGYENVRSRNLSDPADVMATDLDTPTTAALTTPATPATALAVSAYLDGLGASSRRTMRSALDAVACIVRGIEPDPRRRRGVLEVRAEDLPWERIDAPTAARLRRMLDERIDAGTTSMATANKYLAAIRGVLRAGWRLRAIDGDTVSRLCEGTDAPLRHFKAKGQRPPTGRYVSQRERVGMVRAVRELEGPRAMRDAVILALLDNGLRRAEVSRVMVADLVDGATGVDVVGKGRRHRRVWLDAAATAAIRAWLDERGETAGYLCCRLRKGGVVLPGDGVTSQTIANVMAAAAELAGVEDVRCHDWRRTYITDLIDARVDLVLVSDLAGHSDPRTTARYDRRTEDRRRAAALSRTGATTAAG